MRFIGLKCFFKKLYFLLNLSHTHLAPMEKITLTLILVVTSLELKIKLMSLRWKETLLIEHRIKNLIKVKSLMHENSRVRGFFGLFHLKLEQKTQSCLAESEQPRPKSLKMQ